MAKSVFKCQVCVVCEDTSRLTLWHKAINRCHHQRGVMSKVYQPQPMIQLFNLKTS